MRQAQEANSLPNLSSLDAPITASQPKRNLSASADTNTEDGEHDDRGVNEQPKPRTSLLFRLKSPRKLTHLSCHRQKATHHAWHYKCFAGQAYCYQ
jgi:hypothetical protein